MHSLLFIPSFCLSACLLLSVFADSEEISDESARHTVSCRADDNEPWSYRGKNGPQYWAEGYPECHGLRQSPIFIDTGKLDTSRTLHKIFFYYSTPIANALVRNDGHTLEVTPVDNSWRHIYINNAWHRLRQIHFHWGSNKNQGSEHVVDGVRYPMEMHLVHRSDNNGTAVVAVLFEEVDEINAELQHLVNEIPKVMYKDSEITMHYRLDAMNFLPENPASYYWYEGSLTTPNCTEGVIWAVLKLPNHVGSNQMREFRKLYSSRQNMTENGCKISDNFRPLQRLYRRRVYSSR